MKYYYSKSNEDGQYRKLSSSRNMDDVSFDHDKVVVISEDNIFHVMTFEESYCNDEKYVLDRSELVNYLKNNKKNVYFFNCNKYIPYSILKDVNLDKEQVLYDLPMIPDSIYTVKEDEILKINVTVDKNIIKDAIRDVYIREYNRGSNFKRVELKDFIKDESLLKLYNLPLLDKGNSFLIPEYSYVHPSLFYVLNGIYSKKMDDKISLDEQNIKDLYLEYFSEDSDIVDKIIKNIEVNVNKKYDINELSKSIDYIEDIKKQENDTTIELNKVKIILKKAKQNEKIIKDLGILDNREELNHEKIKK